MKKGIFHPFAMRAYLGALAILLPAHSVQSQQLRQFANRVEGTVVQPNALDDFRIVGLHRSFQPVQRNSTLSVRFFVPDSSAGTATKVTVSAIERQDLKHYLMRSADNLAWRPGRWNTFAPWPTADVMDGLNIPWANLGVVALYGSAGTQHPARVYLPVDVFSSSAPGTLGKYVLHVFIGHDIQSLTALTVGSNGAQVQLSHLHCEESLNRNCTLFAGGTTPAIDLDMSHLPPGYYDVFLVAKAPHSTQTTSFPFTVFHAMPP